MTEARETPGNQSAETEAATKIRVCHRGPLLIEGPIQLSDDQGQIIPLPQARKIALCRCIASQSQPFCDGSHNRVNWSAALSPADDDLGLDGSF